MQKSELQQQLKELAIKHQNEIGQLKKQYADANNPHKEGDIVRDHIGWLQIQSISYYFKADDAECIYYGLELLSDKKTPSKKQSKRPVYQSNLNKNV